LDTTQAPQSTLIEKEEETMKMRRRYIGNLLRCVLVGVVCLQLVVVPAAGKGFGDQFSEE